MILNRKAVAPICFREINQSRRNRVAVEGSNRRFPRVAARRGNPGLEVIAPLGQ